MIRKGVGYLEEFVNYVTYISVRPSNFIEGEKNYIAMEKEDEVHKDPSKLFNKIREYVDKKKVKLDEIILVFCVPRYYAPRPGDEGRYWISPEGHCASPLNDTEVKYFRKAFENFLRNLEKGENL